MFLWMLTVNHIAGDFVVYRQELQGDFHEEDQPLHEDIRLQG